MRISFDKFEAAILLDKLIDVLEGKIPRKFAVEYVSRKLREYAVRRGLEIDDIYRNSMGIYSQMSKLEFIFTDGESGTDDKKSKLFQEIVDLYKYDRENYDVLIKEAKEKIETITSIQDKFFAWLAKKTSPAQLSEYYISCDDIDKFCLKENILDKKLFEITDVNVINNLKNILDSNKKFRSRHKHGLSKINSALKFYSDFLNENFESPAPRMIVPRMMIPKPAVTKKIPEPVADNEIKNISPDKTTLNRKNFLIWLKSKNIDQTMRNLYSFSISLLNRIVAENKIADTNLYLITDPEKLQRIKKISTATTSFHSLQDKYQKSILSAIDKLIEFCGGVSNTVVENNLYEKYAEILNKYFGENGYQPGRSIAVNKFKNYFKSEYGEFPTESDKQIDDILQKIGTLIDGRIFPKQGDNQNKLIDEIVGDIISAFNDGASAVYIESVYEKYRQKLADDLKIYNVDALTPLLTANSQGKFFQKNSHFKIHGRPDNPAEDVLNVLKESHQPMSYNDIHRKVWFVPYDKLKQFIFKDKSIAYVAQDKYFYAPNLPIDDDEQKKIISLIQSEIDFHGYVTDSKLMSLIQEKYPSIAMNLEGFTAYGVRNCLDYLLKNYFAFNGSVISKFGEKLNAKEIFADFSREHEKMFLENLKTLAKDLNIGIIWDVVLSETVRVSQDLFVRKDLIDFDVDLIDDVLAEMCPQDYISLKEINLFMNFPNVGYAWNSYLVESFLYSHSRKFRLIHNSFSENFVFGAMVKIDSKIQDYYSLIVDVLSHSNALDSINDALKFIVEQGYQQRKSYKDIEKAILKAKLIKEKREQEEH